ncbi:aromatic ring-hydroxylating dioxygenase subunit alpha [Aeromicrobium sp. CF4.19]|uniref:aromatic ring-hydroxylating oxygenase subunit alpha n=1 Tax=Aeromicrobium sp. CF4.19 TaxID=3373082 RepID=UPI003EE46E5E
MRTEREVELSDEFFRLLETKGTSMAAKPRTQVTSVYTDPGYLADERRTLFRGRPLLFCLSGELAEPGAYVTAELDGLPVVVLRGEDEHLRAMVNMCSHRGARIYTEERGTVQGRGVSCPFHAWTYDIYGRLMGQPLAREGFKDCDRDALSMRHLDVFERHGAVFVTPADAGSDAGEGFDPTKIFGAADDDLRDLNLKDCRLVESHTRTIGLNWKLVIDTFLESYHVFSLHRDTLATRQLSAPGITEDLGPVGLVVGIRNSIFEEQDKPSNERRFSPHATLQYILYPNVIVSHQIDHIETWQVCPGAGPDEALVRTSIYSYGSDIDERTERYLRRSIEVLMAVTDEEDFPQVVQTQRALMAGGIGQFTFGRNEPGLIAYHEWLDDAMTT